jgi:hypothetical protein
MLSSFAVLLVLYHVIMMAGNLHMTADDIRYTGMHARTMLAVYQVLVVSVLLSTHSVFLYFIRVVKKDQTSFVLVRLPLDVGESAPATPLAAQNRAQDPQGQEKQGQERQGQERQGQERQWQERQWQERQWQELHSQEREREFQRLRAASASLADAHWQDPEKDVAREAERREAERREEHRPEAGSRATSVRAPGDAGSTQYAAEDASITASEASGDAVPLSIVFESSANLDLYVLYVNFVGLVLWDTFVSFNFATPDSNFVLVCGLVCGWILNSLSKECRCHVFLAPAPPGQKLVFLFYSGVFVLVMSLGALHWRVPDDLDTGMRINLYLPAFCSGLFWTGISADVAFTGVVNQGATKGILYDSRRSLPTFLLVMCVSALYSSPETRQSVLAYTAGLSRLALLHLLLIEPVLIFLSIYVMVIALEKQRSTDFTLVMVLVQGARVAYRSEEHDGVAITAIAACVLLLSVHVSRLVRG